MPVISKSKPTIANQKVLNVRKRSDRDRSRINAQINKKSVYSVRERLKNRIREVTFELYHRRNKNLSSTVQTSLTKKVSAFIKPSMRVEFSESEKCRKGYKKR